MSRAFVGYVCAMLGVGHMCAVLGAVLGMCVAVAQADGTDVDVESSAFDEPNPLAAPYELSGAPAAIEQRVSLGARRSPNASERTAPPAPGGPAAYSPHALSGFEWGASIAIGAEPPVDRLLLLKSQRRLILLSGDLPIREYDIALGGDPEGHKQQRGDQRTPEGRYLIDWRNDESDYYRALHISYPNEEDRRRAEELGVDPGGAIMIHGLPNGLELIGSSHRSADWTDGCIAVTNEEMDEIWERVRDGVPIDIRP